MCATVTESGVILLAQEVFKTKERIEQEELRQKIKAAMEFWQTYATEYRVLPIKYFFLLEERRRLKMKLKRLPMSTVDEYPDIPFFLILCEDVAAAYVEDLAANNELDKLLSNLEFILSSDYSYNTLRDWVKETRYELSKLEYQASKKAALCQKSVALAGAF